MAQNNYENGPSIDVGGLRVYRFRSVGTDGPGKVRVARIEKVVDPATGQVVERNKGGVTLGDPGDVTAILAAVRQIAGDAGAFPAAPAPAPAPAPMPAPAPAAGLPAPAPAPAGLPIPAGDPWASLPDGTLSADGTLRKEGQFLVSV